MKITRILTGIMILCICVSCGFGGDDAKADFSAMDVAAHFGESESSILKWLGLKQEDVFQVKEGIPELVEFTPDFAYAGVTFKARAFFSSDGGMRQFYYMFTPENNEKAWDVLMKLYQDFSEQEGAERASGTLRDSTEMPALSKDRGYFVTWLIKDGNQVGQYKLEYNYIKESDVSLIFIEEILSD